MPDLTAILEETCPLEPMSQAAAERRMDEILAHIAEIGRQIETKAKGRRNAEWRRNAMLARDELRKELSAIRTSLDRKKERSAKVEKIRRANEDLTRQEVDRSTREARKLAKDQKPLWDLYLKAEVALLSILNASGAIGPLGESILYSAQKVVPEWYRDHWLHTVYGTTWGRQAEALKLERGSE